YSAPVAKICHPHLTDVGAGWLHDLTPCRRSHRGSSSRLVANGMRSAPRRGAASHWQEACRPVRPSPGRRGAVSQQGPGGRSKGSEVPPLAGMAIIDLPATIRGGGEGKARPWLSLRNLARGGDAGPRHCHWLPCSW